jgi:hypothetical protein
VAWPRRGSRVHPIQMATSIRRIAPIVREKVVQIVSDTDFEAVIAEYIRAKGVTRCPTACVVPTQGSIDAADRAALAEYAVARDRHRRDRAAARARLIWGIALTPSVGK